ncbi:MAG: FHA domain-containing protein [Oscillospiraceae bacterium]|nr:FHA domain-containing protein [Oscillospiraceae bacterium]
MGNIYEIQTKSDILAGVTHSVKIPEDKLDKKALYTLIKERPEFVLPFHHKIMDGEVELVYQAGTCGKFAYMQKNRSVDEYIELWSSVLGPVLECAEWFLTPYSFMLQADYLYFDKGGKSAKYIYIPSFDPCSDSEDLRSMVVHIAKNIKIADINLENKVVWAIQDFNPGEFLQMIKSYRPDIPETVTVSHKNLESTDDISINFFPEKKNQEKKKAGPKGFFLGGKKPPKPKKIAEPTFEPPMAQNADDATQLLEDKAAASARFLYAGSGEHPKTIELDFAAGDIFTIGRFDLSVGEKQSDFEFEPKTKAVSRRHAAIEKTEQGYFLVDLGSLAGTFLGGQKLPPNTPFKLERGCRVSFGFAGAEYIFEQRQI